MTNSPVASPERTLRLSAIYPNQAELIDDGTEEENRPPKKDDLKRNFQLRFAETLGVLLFSGIKLSSHNRSFRPPRAIDIPLDAFEFHSSALSTRQILESPLGPKRRYL